ncbi:MAG: alpha/beta hydrolase [Candidatus Magasanikbacteria bacterium]|nr:alpha/beta hydrolase [Candidatus Magasanikbacteria bacterium]
MTAAKVFFQNSKDQKICGILEKSNKNSSRVVILIHGYSSNKNRPSSLDLATELSKRGINSLRIDLNGCGESEGEFKFQTITSTVDDVEAAMNYLKSLGYSQMELFGASAGGLTAMATALKHPEVARLGLKCPVSDYVDQKIKRKGKGGIQEWKDEGFSIYTSSSSGREHQVDYSVFEDYKNYIMFDKVKDIKCPTLIVHGDADDVVDVEDSKRLVKNFPNAELMIMPGANHTFDKNEDRVWMNRMFGEWFEAAFSQSL